MRYSILKALGSALPGLRWQLAPAAAAPATAFGANRYAHKATTGIVGLPVDEEARQHLKEQLEQVLEAIKIIPAEAEYRRSVEMTVNAKLAAAASDASDRQLEDTFGRQLEQEIKLCKEELKLIPKMAEWRPWDVPPGHKAGLVC